MFHAIRLVCSEVLGNHAEQHVGVAIPGVERVRGRAAEIEIPHVPRAAHRSEGLVVLPVDAELEIVTADRHREVILELEPPIVVAGRHHASIGDRRAVAGEARPVAAGGGVDRQVRILVQLLAVDAARARRVLRWSVVAVVGAVGRDARRAHTDLIAIGLCVVVVVRVTPLVVVVDGESAVQLVDHRRRDDGRDRAGCLPRWYRVVRFPDARAELVDADVVFLIREHLEVESPPVGQRHVHAVHVVDAVVFRCLVGDVVGVVLLIGSRLHVAVRLDQQVEQLLTRRIDAVGGNDVALKRLPRLVIDDRLDGAVVRGRRQTRL